MKSIEEIIPGALTQSIGFPTKHIGTIAQVLQLPQKNAKTY